MSKDTILSSIEDAVEDFRQGKFLIVVDDEDRENEAILSSPQKPLPQRR